jgi:hypothetical protein
MGIVCNNSDRKSSLERQQHMNKKKNTAHGTHRPLQTLIKMKKVKSTFWLFILACSMQILTASTVSNTADQKSRPAQTKQVKPKKTNKSKGHTPLFKSLLNHL